MKKPTVKLPTIDVAKLQQVSGGMYEENLPDPGDWNPRHGKPPTR